MYSTIKAGANTVNVYDTRSEMEQMLRYYKDLENVNIIGSGIDLDVGWYIEYTLNGY